MNPAFYFSEMCPFVFIFYIALHMFYKKGSIIINTSFHLTSDFLYSKQNKIFTHSVTQYKPLVCDFVVFLSSESAKNINVFMRIVYQY